MTHVLIANVMEYTLLCAVAADPAAARCPPATQQGGLRAPDPCDATAVPSCTCWQQTPAQGPSTGSSEAPRDNDAASRRAVGGMASSWQRERDTAALLGAK